MIWTLLTSPKVKGFMKRRRSHNLPAIPPAFDVWKERNHYLVPSIPETDFPCNITSNVTLCGPILPPILPVADVDPELQTWLDRGPTVLIDLGSHIRVDSFMVKEFSVGLKVLLDRQPKMQILWELKTSGGISFPTKKQYQSFSRPPPLVNDIPETEGLEFGALSAIASEICSGRVRVVEWMSIDPLAILQSGRIVCSVHCGGSNSFHEALR
jgi:hypothetical protein